MKYVVLIIFELIKLHRGQLITTSKGSIQGKLVTEQGNNYQVFEGIPFAKPPIGELRFEAPIKPDSWQNTLLATTFSLKCIQPDILQPGEISEDCLYLNVFAPQRQRQQTSYPVMVWIHGGAFNSGSASDYPEKGILSNLVSRGVIVVTINYRLGPLGFWTTETKRNPGNIGILDQIMALGWVNTEIRAFGGDPSRVTIFGESAGSGSVSILTLAAPNDWWQQAIMMSGTSYSPWSLKPKNSDSNKIGSTFVSLVNCSASTKLENLIQDSDAWNSIFTKLTNRPFSSNSNPLDNVEIQNIGHWLSNVVSRVKNGNLNLTGDAIIKEFLARSFGNPMDMMAEEMTLNCLKALPIATLLDAQNSMMTALGGIGVEMYWAPRVDGQLVVDGAAENRKTNKKILLGTTKDEWGLWDVYLPELTGQSPQWNKSASSVRNTSIPLHFSILPTNNAQLSIRASQYAYVDIPLANQDTRDPLFWFKQNIKFFSATYFVIPTYLEAIGWQSVNNDVFLYSYDFLSESALIGSPWRGVVHASELPYLFDIPMDNAGGLGSLFGHTKTASDTQIVNDMGQYWTNFAKFGNPTPSANLGRNWNRFNPEENNYFSINYPSSQMFNGYNAYDVEFGKYLNSLQKPVCF